MATQKAQVFDTTKIVKKPVTPSSLRDDRGRGKAPLSGVKTGSTDKAGLKLNKKA